MNRLNFGMVSVSVLLIAAGTAMAHQEAVKPVPAGEPGKGLTAINPQPALEKSIANKGGAFEFEAMVHDWGAISDEETVKYSFKFKNVSDQTVKILNTKTTCGCSVAAPTKQVLAPSEEAVVEVTYNPTGKRGLELKTVTLETDYLPHPNVELHLKAMVRPRIMVEPSSIWFGEVPLGQPAEQEFSIISRIEGFKVDSFSIIDPAQASRFKVEQLPADKVDVDGSMLDRVRFKATFLGKDPIGTYNTGIRISTNDAKRPEQNVSLACRVIGELMPSPERVFVTMTGPGTPWTSEVLIQSRNKQAFDIYSVEAVGVPATMKIVLDIVPGTAAQPMATNAVRIKASGLSPAAPNEVGGSIKVRTGVAGMEEFSLPLMAIYRGPMPTGSQMINPPLPPK